MLELAAPLADFLPRSTGPYVSLMIAGFFVAVFGHLAKSRWLVAIGVLMISLATVIFPLARIATEENPPHRQPQQQVPEVQLP
jgi:hypothetical protein